MTRKSQSYISDSETSGPQGPLTTTEIVGFLFDEFEREHGVSLLESHVALWRTMGVADQVRQSLTAEDAVNVSLPFMHRKLHLEVYVSRDALMSRRKRRG